VAYTLGEMVAIQFVGSTGRGISSNNKYRPFGLVGSSSRLNNTFTDTNSSSQSLLSEDNVGNNTLIISDPTPSREPHIFIFLRNYPGLGTPNFALI
jgi:hypothetical protein